MTDHEETIAPERSGLPAGPVPLRWGTDRDGPILGYVTLSRLEDGTLLVSAAPDPMTDAYAKLRDTLEAGISPVDYARRYGLREDPAALPIRQAAPEVTETTLETIRAAMAEVRRLTDDRKRALLDTAHGRALEARYGDPRPQFLAVNATTYGRLAELSLPGHDPRPAGSWLFDLPLIVDEELPDDTIEPRRHEPDRCDARHPTEGYRCRLNRHDHGHHGHAHEGTADWTTWEPTP